MINLAVLANELKDINIIEILSETFIPFVLLGFAIGGSWRGLKFCIDILKNG